MVAKHYYFIMVPADDGSMHDAVVRGPTDKFATPAEQARASFGHVGHTMLYKDMGTQVWRVQRDSTRQAALATMEGWHPIPDDQLNEGERRLRRLAEEEKNTAFAQFLHQRRKDGAPLPEQVDAAVEDLPAVSDAEADAAVLAARGLGSTSAGLGWAGNLARQMAPADGFDDRGGLSDPPPANVTTIRPPGRDMVRLDPAFVIYVESDAVAEKVEAATRGNPLLVYINGYRAVVAREDEEDEVADRVAAIVKEPN